MCPSLRPFGRADVRTPNTEEVRRDALPTCDQVSLSDARLTCLILDFGEGNGSDLHAGGLIWIQNFNPTGSYLHD
jgi:hypothetical protein